MWGKNSTNHEIGPSTGLVISMVHILRPVSWGRKPGAGGPIYRVYHAQPPTTHRPIDFGVNTRLFNFPSTWRHYIFSGRHDLPQIPPHTNGEKNQHRCSHRLTGHSCIDTTRCIHTFKRTGEFRYKLKSRRHRGICMHRKWHGRTWFHT